MDKIDSGVHGLFSMFCKPTIYGSLSTSLILFYAYFHQNKWIYTPDIPHRDLAKNPENSRHPSERNLRYEEVYVTTTDNIKLHGWLILQKDNMACHTVVFYHGIGGNIGLRLPFVHLYMKRARCNVLMMAYRGYSYSEGVPSERGIKLDIEAITEHVFKRTDIDTNRVFLHGHSFGGAAATYAAYACNKDQKYKGIVLENTFLSLPDVIDHHFPRLKKLLKCVIRNVWSNKERMPSIKIPILFVISMNDEIVPFSHSMKLKELAKDSILTQTYEIPGGTHGEGWRTDIALYFTKLNTFFEKSQQLAKDAGVTKVT